MRRGERVRVKKLAEVEQLLRGKTGTVIKDSKPGEVILVGMDHEPETEAQQLFERDLERIN